MTSGEARQAFLDFFMSKSHQVVPSAPMVVKNDPTLMFTNAGMNQFKDIFLGNTEPKQKRVANSQKCLRVSGKHNDLDEVGHDTYHHTMFEMLGNWSFGDYFKKEAIEWAWEFLVDVLKLNSSDLYATVFEGSPEDGLEVDKESMDLWRQFLPEDRVLLGSKKDNFWEMGDSGPCGPCSEVHIDLRSPEEKSKISGRELVNEGHPQVVEIWNLVFIQFNRKANGSLESLPAKHVDTGMGFERLCMALQGKQSNYDTDVFQPIIQEISRECGIAYGNDIKTDVAMRVVADHLRAVSFSIADGQLPSNVKAGYVIRRILRRAVRYGYTFLNFNEPFINKLVPILANQMGKWFPELTAQQELITKVIFEEEQSFLRTLETGIRMLDGIMEKASKQGKKEITGNDAFILYDTYGFPFDLTELILREHGLSVSKADFEKEMKVQKDRSRSVASVETHDWIEIIPNAETQFVGYDSLKSEVKITRYRTVKQKGKEQYHLVFNKTPFYAESGGQVGDMGTITSSNETIKILNTVKENNLTIHLVDKLPAEANSTFMAEVDVNKRICTANNHTATHLLHHALREVLGSHVEQKGSLVHPDYLRFDFAHFQKMTDEEIRRVESLVNEAIRQNTMVDEHRDVPMDQAQQMGAIALFGEKYGDAVRVIRFGDSVELCGGTHVSATGNIGLFKIVSEGAISAGIRRIEAITAQKAEDFLYQQVDFIKNLKALMGNPPDVMVAAEKLVNENSSLRKQIEAFTKEHVKNLKGSLISTVASKNGASVIAQKVDIDNADALKDLAYQIRNEVPDLFLVLGAEINEKPLLTVMVAESIIESKKADASTIIREAAKEMKGGGGGQPFYATAGGKDPQGLEKAIAKAVEIFVKL
ncbi:alanine--tRNA ligase [Perlabentimonas gracilis]|uniref:alanine--tRNA ligase n=1 Tax=Perlabentimonas gracilis TaxID=2715279 RepID=UPI00140A2663|nr:alanine--tRNA ligase [Perlabentimonas gracilis]NHB69057.1 alanine--tRNA ligase [Perlabentimonas gracilis]